MVTRDDIPLLTDTHESRGNHKYLDIEEKSDTKSRDFELTNTDESSNDCEQGKHLKDKHSKSIWKDTNARQKAILIYIIVVYFISYLCTSSASPFFARVAITKGSNVVFSTIILQINMITMAISSVIFGKYQSRIGCKTLVVFGQIAFAVTQISFGSIGYIDDKWTVVIVGASLRALSGIFQAAFNVAGLTIVCQEFPEFVSIVFGLCEAAYGSGAFVGPYLGGFLYDLSGNTLVPMAVAGGAALLTSTLGFVTLKSPTNDTNQIDTDTSHISRILSEPRAILIIGAAGTVAGSFFVCDATVTIYLKEKGFSATGVGQLLFVVGVGYTVVAAIVGYITSKRKCLRRLVFLSGLVGSFSFPLLFTPMQTDFWVYLAALGFAMSIASAFIVAFEELRYVINKEESSQDADESLISALSGLWNTVIATGDFTIPLIGSALETTFQFYISFSGSVLLGYAATLVAAASMCSYRFYASVVSTNYLRN